ncbi:AlpA family phage regulatory protein [Pseudomonas sp. BN414]|uniref:helix-turn-helix transcriptional regulator n=1 Tax=Pseudomonas sp. BN414 TaxID=2567888 RepID=UPI00245686C1|nr:AlpA family phage regulatory protein [Pseudomonas sp. BN414]MDH4565948.1 AlpA family phage regulatory protein [Pseudomonas sp. BN414]
MDTNPPDTHPVFLLRLRDVIARVGLQSSFIYQAVKKGTFPKPIKLGDSVSVAWLDFEIDAWLKARGDSRHPVNTPRPRRLKGCRVVEQAHD